jgi:predicted kinase
MKTLILIRGLPGAGKSTFAAILSPDYLEADQFFIEDGVYNFNIARLGAAHLWCQNAAYNQFLDGKEIIVISNTFTTKKEMKPYIDMADEFGYRIVTLIVENRHGSQSIHNVPQETLDNMKNRFSVQL